MKIKKYFWNNDENRLRAGWRLCVYILILLAATLALGLVSGLLVVLLRTIFPAIRDNLIFANLVQMLVITLIMILGSWVTARWVDRRKITSLGLQFDRSWWRDLAFGAFLGFFLMLLIFLTELAFGLITVESYLYAHPDYANFWSSLLVYAFQFICVGIYEELFSRGYQLVNLAEGFSFVKDQKTGLWIAYIITSSIFGLLHAMNPGASVSSVLNIIIAGFFLGLGMLLTGRIGLSIGLHITWNFFQGNVFGFPVSGIGTGVSLIQISQGGRDWFTGGQFGPEGGVISLLAILVGVFCILAWVKWQYGELRLGLLDNLFKIPTPMVLPNEDFD
jgi:membrane protease YdiL (CAAX protease family)